MQPNHAMLTKLLCVILSTVLTTAAHAQQIIYVNAAAIPGGDGTSWARAHRFLQDALAIAASMQPTPETAVEIRIANGSYMPDRSTVTPNGSGNQALSFRIPPHTALKGGYFGSGSNPDRRDLAARATVLSGDLAGNDTLNGYTNHTENSNNVVMFDNADYAAIDGCVISGGNAQVSIDDPHDRREGGAVFARNSLIALYRCVLRRNIAARQGGALGIEGGGLAMSDCLIYGNRSENHGGAALSARNANTTLVNCTIASNESFGSPLEISYIRVDGRSCIFYNCIITCGCDRPILLQSQALATSFRSHWSTSIGAPTGPTGDTYGDPGFADDEYRLIKSSQCRNTGSTANLPTASLLDVDGRIRVWDGFIDKGAHEFGAPSALDRLYVRQDLVSGANDGSDWKNAYRGLTGLRLAVDRAATSLGTVSEIWVAGGVYKAASPGSGDTSGYVLPEGVSVYGGFAGTETSPSQRVLGAHPTLLNGDINSNDQGNLNRGDNTAVMLMALWSGTTIDGLAITNAGSDGGGIGVLANASSGTVPITLKNCTVTRTSGSALHSSGVPGCRIERSVFTHNSGDDPCLRVLGGVLTANRVEISNNSSNNWAGGLHVLDGGAAIFSQSSFIGNAGQDGGAVACSEGQAWFANCRFTRNSAVGGSVAYCTGSPIHGGVAFDNCLLDHNQASNGPAIWLDGAGGAMTVRADQTTIAFNTSILGATAAAIYISGTAPRASLRNCIVWGNDRSGSYDEFDQLQSADPTQIMASYSLVQGWSGSFAGSMTQDADPLFVDPDGPDNIGGNEDDRFDISAGSPAIDAASPMQATNDPYDLDEDGENAESWPFDLLGSLRFIDDPGTQPNVKGPLDPIPVDIGAYEFAPICPACPVHAWLRTDGGSFNLDGNWLYGVPSHGNLALFDQAVSQTVTLSAPASVRALQVNQGEVFLDLGGQRLTASSGSGESLVVSGSAVENPSLILTSSMAGGVFDSRLGKIGLAPSEFGSLTVTGVNTRLSMPLATLAIGVEGRGTLAVLDGAAASAQILTVGEFPGSTGFVVVSGANSRLLPKFGLNLFSGSVVVEEGGLIDLGTTGDVIVLPGSSISGNGTIRSDVVNFGTIDPALGSVARGTLGTLTIIGEFEQVGVDPKAGFFSGTLHLNVTGTGNTITSDSLAVTGAARLAGALLVEPIGGFNPSPSAPPASLLSAATTIGRFDLAVFPGLTGNKFMRLAYPSPFERGGAVSVSVDTLAENIDLDPATSASVSGRPNDLVLADFDTDGDADLALCLPDAANPDSQPGQVVILRNAGNTGPGGSWAGFTGGQVTVNVGANPRGIAAGRLNADTAPDLIVANFSSNTVTVLTNANNGAAAMNVTQTIPVGTGPVAVVTGVLRDASGGAIDAAVANHGSDSVSILHNTSGALAVTSTLASGDGPSDITIARLDAGAGQSTLDIAVTNENDHTATVYYRPPGGGYPLSPSRVLPTSIRPVTIEPGGLDNPKDLNDLAVSNNGSGSVSILLNNNLPDGLAGFQPKADLPTGATPGSLTLGDLDSDGDPDLSVVSMVGGQQVVSVFRNDAQEVSPGVFQAAFAPFGDQYAGLDPRLVTSGDVNNDGRDDLIAVNDLTLVSRPPFAAGASSLPRQSERGIVAQPNVSISLSAAPFVPPPCVGDFTNDRAVNTADLVFFLGAFGKPATPPGSGADINADATVNTADLVIFLGVFGQVCP